ncbi:FAD:protein FMN transferase, partial [Acinetobacter baumannii]|nr:FAD:protein FMN transferase [Acinetobacter baumannii]
ELIVSPFNKKSIISAINTNESDSVDEYIDTLFSNSLRINKETGGAFDPTLSPLINAWGFGYKSGNLPDYAEVDSI